MSEHFDPATPRRFRQALLRWYDQHKRELPWRVDQDPYRVWVSEVMLQQTRVAVVLAYYQRFMDRFPDVQSLARAREASVLAVWSGLGYYRRARAMHATARVVVKEYRGCFPKSASELQNLPGVGRYTAAAVASIAFGEAVAVVDGNVERVLDRVTCMRIEARAAAARKAAYWEAAQELLSTARPGDFNQAMMELGATVCAPVQPRCGECPIKLLCRTKGVTKGTQSEVRQKREVEYALCIEDGRVYLVRRAGNSSLMAGMWELPVLDEDSEHAPLFTLRHSITDCDYLVTVAKQTRPGTSGGQWFRLDRIARLPLTGLARKILAKTNIIE